MKINFHKKSISVMLILALFCSIIAPLALDAQPVEAAGSYYIRVNKATNVVTVYKNKKNGVYKDPVKAFICSVGSATPIGTFKTPNKYRWWTLDGPSYGQYCTRITGSILFHSVWYYENGKNNTISVAQYNKLGQTASHGCVRLTVEDAKWIYDNCSLGTEVNVFWGTSKDDPLGKPVSIKLDPNKRTDWCPTDPQAGNPYKNKKPVISGAKNKSYQLGTKQDWRSGITAKDTAGNDITKLVKYTGNVNRNKEGTYYVKYGVTDALNRKALKTITVKVYDKQGPIISGAKNITVNEGSKPINLLKGITAKTRSGKNVTSSLTVTGDVNYNKAGTYYVTYTATSPSGYKSSKKVKVVVAQNEAPVISGTKNYQVALDSEPIDLMNGVTAKTASGEDLTADIVVSGEVDYTRPGEYKITYTVTNSKQVTTTKTITVKVVDDRPVAIIGAVDRTIDYTNQSMSDEAKVSLIQGKIMEGVTAYLYGEIQDSSKIVTKIEKLGENIYKVIYTLKDDIDNEEVVETIFTLQYQQQ